MTHALAGCDGGARGKDAGSVRIRRIRARPRTQTRPLQRGQTARAHFVGASKPVAEQRDTLETITIVDVDVHVHEDPAQMAEYADPPWDTGLREIAKVEERYLDLPGISPRAEYRVPFPGGSNRRQIAA